MAHRRHTSLSVRKETFIPENSHWGDLSSTWPGSAFCLSTVKRADLAACDLVPETSSLTFSDFCAGFLMRLPLRTATLLWFGSLGTWETTFWTCWVYSPFQSHSQGSIFLLRSPLRDWCLKCSGVLALHRDKVMRRPRASFPEGVSAFPLCFVLCMSSLTATASIKNTFFCHPWRSQLWVTSCLLSSFLSASDRSSLKLITLGVRFHPCLLMCSVLDPWVLFGPF